MVRKPGLCATISKNTATKTPIYALAEASVGINSKAVVRGVQREDKNILGSIHFGIGTNIDVGGTIHSKIHMDGVILEPTLYVDGEKRIEKGRFLRPVDRPLLSAGEVRNTLKRAGPRRGTTAWPWEGSDEESRQAHLARQLGWPCATGASAQSVDSVYRNKTLRILVPTGAGGDRSLYTNVFASFSGAIPGNPAVVPVFMPGAGGSVALNNAYSVAASDGLTIVTPLTSVLAAQIVGDQSVKYDATKFQWIGRTADATRVLFVSTKLNIADAR